MVFTPKAPKLILEEVRSLSKLEGQALANKQQRDQELEAIIRGEDQRILLVIGPCSSDNEEAVLSMPSVWQNCKKKSKIMFLWRCASTLLNHVPMVMVIRA